RPREERKQVLVPALDPRHALEERRADGQALDRARDGARHVEERVQRGLREQLAEGLEAPTHRSPPRTPVSQSWTSATLRPRRRARASVTRRYAPEYSAIAPATRSTSPGSRC